MISKTRLPDAAPPADDLHTRLANRPRKPLDLTDVGVPHFPDPPAEPAPVLYGAPRYRAPPADDLCARLATDAELLDKRTDVACELIADDIREAAAEIERLRKRLDEEYEIAEKIRAAALAPAEPAPIPTAAQAYQDAEITLLENLIDSLNKKDRELREYIRAAEARCVELEQVIADVREMAVSRNWGRVVAVIDAAIVQGKT